MAMARVHLPSIAYQEGLAAARPAAAITLLWLVWYSTDSGALSYCNGSAWIPMGGTPPASITRITSTGASVTVTNPTGPTTNLEVAGGGGVVFADVRELVFSYGQTIDPAGTILKWEHGGGGALLDYTDPYNPTVIAAGLYTFAMFVSLAIHAGEFGTWTLILDAYIPTQIFVETTWPLDGDATNAQTFGPIALTAYLPAGAVATTEMWHTDAAPIPDVVYQGVIQKII